MPPFSQLASVSSLAPRPRTARRGLVRAGHPAALEGPPQRASSSSNSTGRQPTPQRRERKAARAFARDRRGRGPPPGAGTASHRNRRTACDSASRREIISRRAALRSEDAAHALPRIRKRRLGKIADFYRTDVEVPAKLTVDGKTYAEVGVHFRGASSFHSQCWPQAFAQSRWLTNQDAALQLPHAQPAELPRTRPSCARPYYHVARQYLAAPVITSASSSTARAGASMSTPSGSARFQEWFGSTKARFWKAPAARAATPTGLSRRRSGDYKRLRNQNQGRQAVVGALLKLCRTLNETPADKLEATAARCSISTALKFLALENVLINADGYWIRTSDYNSRRAGPLPSRTTAARPSARPKAQLRRRPRDRASNSTRCSAATIRTSRCSANSSPRPRSRRVTSNTSAGWRRSGSVEQARPARRTIQALIADDVRPTRTSFTPSRPSARRDQPRARLPRPPPLDQPQKLRRAAMSTEPSK